MSESENKQHNSQYRKLLDEFPEWGKHALVNALVAIAIIIITYLVTRCKWGGILLEITDDSLKPLETAGFVFAVVGLVFTIFNALIDRKQKDLINTMANHDIELKVQSSFFSLFLLGWQIANQKKMTSQSIPFLNLFLESADKVKEAHKNGQQKELIPWKDLKVLKEMLSSHNDSIVNVPPKSGFFAGQEKPLVKTYKEDLRGCLQRLDQIINS